MKPVAYLGYGLLGMVVLLSFWAIAGEAVWAVLPITLLFLVSLYFPVPLKATIRHAKALQSLRAILHHGFCHLVIPACLLVLFITIQHFEAYPAIGSLLRGFAAFLFVLPVIFILRENRRGMKLSAYFFVMFLVALVIPQFWAPTAKFTGGLMARAWIARLSGETFRYPGMKHTAVGETDGILLVSLPPTMLFISAQKEPRCIGYPQDAAQGCQETLERLIHSQSFIPPAAREK
ncbi:MAG: hypothetical protein LBU11_00335 [Zoogloeaceae bacterium]|jgi:uncharacterized membrane protein|nr:hypothetical protein [Zoogloeaceae bacterium]